MDRITEIKTIKIDHECKENAVCLFWRGTNGGPNVWVFDRVQTEGEESTVGAEFFPYNDDLETANSNAEYISKEAQPQLIIGAYVEVEDLSGGINPGSLPGLKGLMTRSIDVFMLMNNDTWETEGCKWMRVRVAPGTFKILDTNQTRARVEMTLLLPTINIPSQ